MDQDGATVSTYWGDAEATSVATCPGVPIGTPQYGFLKTTTTATPASGSGITTEYVYDLLGRTVGTRRSGDAGWSCVTYDARGRVTNSRFADWSGSTATREVATAFSFNSEGRFTTTVTDSSLPTGTVPSTSSIDLLGRAVSSTDVWGTVTTPNYQMLTGRVNSVTIDPANGDPLTQAYDYDLDGKTLWVEVNGVEVAHPTYDAATQLLTSIAYPTNGTSLSAVNRNPFTGSADGTTWSFPVASTPHPAEEFYTTGFESGADSWAPGLAGTTTPRAGTGSFETATTHPLGGTVTASRTITGLTVDRTYTATAWVNTDTATGVDDLAIGVAGIGTATPVAAGTGYQQLTYQFQATAASHDLVLSYTASDDVGSHVLWDDITLTKDAWTEATAASTVTDLVVRSQSGRILRNTLTDSASAAEETSDYSYDAAGRLVKAEIPRHTLTYGFGPTTSCVNNAAGKNGNRTAFTDAFDADGDDLTAAVTMTTTYCYDNADRLTSTTVPLPQSGANPVTGTSLSTTGPSPTLAYDAHGNTTKLADQTIAYDTADRHIGTTLTDGTTITYLLDAGGRMVQRTVDASGTDDDSTIRYLAGGAIADGNGVVQQWVLSLPGGVTLTLDVGDGSQRWGFPNLHGDVIVTADEAGARVGVRSVYVTCPRFPGHLTSG